MMTLKPEYKSIQPTKKPTKYLAKYGPITGYGSPLWEPGLDVDLKKGDPVYSPKEGKVVYAGVKGGFGNQVEVETATGTRIMLSHLDNITVKKGDILKRNQIVGLGGNSGSVIAGPGGDGSHLDITVKQRDGKLMDARGVEKYVNSVDRSKMANDIIKARERGMTDTEILDLIKQKQADLAPAIDTARTRYKTDKSIRDDRELTNFLAKKYSGVDRLPVASNPIPNGFKKEGISKDQVIAAGKAYGLFDGSESVLGKIYDSGDTKRFNDLIQAKEKERTIGGETLDQSAIGTIGRGFQWLSDKITAGAAAIATAELPGTDISFASAVGSVIEPAGYIIGKHIGQVSQSALETGDLFKKVVKGEAKLSDIPEAGKRVKEAGEKYGLKTADFGKETGEEGAKLAPMVLLGKRFDQLFTVPFVYSAARAVADNAPVTEIASKTAAAVAVGYLSKYGTGKYISKEAKTMLDDFYTKALKKPTIEVAKLMEDTLVSIPMQKTNAINRVKDQLENLVRPVSSRFPSESSRVQFYNKLIDGVEAVAENKGKIILEAADGELVSGVLPKTLSEATQAIEQTQVGIFKEYDNLAKKAGEKGIEMDMSEVVAELRKISADRVTETLRPEIKGYVDDLALRLEKVKFTAPEMQDAIKQLNNSLKAFYKMPDYNSASKAVVDAGVVNMFRKQLTDTIDKLGDGDYGLLKRRYGSLIELEKELNKRLQRELNKNKVGLIDFTDIFSAGDILAGLAHLNPAQVAKGATQIAVKNWMKFLNSPDRAVRKMFKAGETLKEVRSKEIDRLKKVYSNAIDEAKKNQKIIGGRLEKGFYAAGARDEMEALMQAEASVMLIEAGKTESRLLTSPHAWVNKAGKIFDTFYDNGFTEKSYKYIPDDKLQDFILHQDSFKQRLNQPLMLPETTTIPLPDKYANLPNKGSFVKGVDAKVISARDVDSGRFKKAWTSDGKGDKKLYSNLVGAVAGLKEDENGNIYFDTKYALMGVAGFMVGKKTLDLVKKDMTNVIKLTDDEVKAVDKLLGPGHQNILSEFRAAAMSFANDTTPKKEFYKIVNKLDQQWKALSKNEEGFVKLPGDEGFKDSGDLTLKVFKELEGKTEIPKNEIVGIMNKGGIKQQEKDLINDYLEKQQGNKINIEDMAKTLKAELLPLERKVSGGTKYSDSDRVRTGERYEAIVLPSELRGSVKEYRENIYESPIKTLAGNTHFSGDTNNYFGHTRIEDMAGKDTRRVVEVQSDLYQKGNLENETNQWSVLKGDESVNKIGEKELQKRLGKRELEAQKLQQYSNPTAHFRMVREEVKQAAIDGKSKLQFPTGETAMKIEGLTQETSQWYWNYGRITESDLNGGVLKVGNEIRRGSNDKWIVTEVLGDGKFKAIQKDFYEEMQKGITRGGGNLSEFAKQQIERNSEQFDISGKIDTNNPIYKFYEKDLGRYLYKEYGAKLVTDDKGVKWYEVDVDEKLKDLPTNAFGFTSPEALLKASTGMLAAMGLYKTAKGEIKELGGTADPEEKETQTPVDYVDFDEQGNIKDKGQMTKEQYQNEINKKPEEKKQEIKKEVKQEVKKENRIKAETKFQDFVPEQYKESIEKHAKRYGVDPKAVAALIMTENRGWDNKATPKSWAPTSTSVGLGQINNATKEDIKKIIGDFSRENPEDSIEAISAWVNKLGEKIGSNNIEDIIQAYNVGQGAFRSGKRNPAYLETFKKFYNQ